MQISKFIQSAAFAVASMHMLLPHAAFAVELRPAAPQQAQAPASIITDVTLSERGIVSGQVLDSQGNPVAKTPVSIQFQGKEVAVTSTDAQGNFSVSGLRGGVHTVIAADGVAAYRLWTANTAPPAAKNRVLIVSGQQIVRGAASSLTTVGVIGGIVGGTVAGGVVSQANSTPASP